MSRETWPDVLREIAEIVGDELTLRLADIHGGIEGVYIPKSPTTSHPWAIVLGPEPWRAICANKKLGGQRISLPRGTFIRLRKTVILELAEQRLSRRAIARRAKVSERYVRMVLGELPPTQDPAQASLPFDE